MVSGKTLGLSQCTENVRQKSCSNQVEVHRVSIVNAVNLECISTKYIPLHEKQQLASQNLLCALALCSVQ